MTEIAIWPPHYRIQWYIKWVSHKFSAFGPGALREWLFSCKFRQGSAEQIVFRRLEGRFRENLHDLWHGSRAGPCATSKAAENSFKVREAKQGVVNINFTLFPISRSFRACSCFTSIIIDDDGGKSRLLCMFMQRILNHHLFSSVSCYIICLHFHHCFRSSRVESIRGRSTAEIKRLFVKSYITS